MKSTQQLLDELKFLCKNWNIKIEYSYQYYLDGNKTPYLIVMMGRNVDDHWETGFIDKLTGNQYLEYSLPTGYSLDNYYECFEGGFEEDIDDCLNKMIENIKEYKK